MLPIGSQNRAGAGAARRLLFVILIGASVVLLLRAAFGPFQFFGLPINSPLTAESIVGFLAVLSFVSFRGGRGLLPERQLHASLLLAAAFMLLAVVIYWPDLHNPFLGDDYILVSSASPHGLRWLGHLLSTGGGDGGFRPLGEAWFDTAEAWAGWIPVRWHVLSLALHLTNCLLVYAFTWSLWRNTFVSSASMTLFAIHASHPEAVAWTAGGFDLLACCFCLLALLCLFLPERFSWRAVLAANFCFLLGLLSKESAYALPVLVAAFAIASGRVQDRTIRAGFLSTCAVALVMLAYRWKLFHGPGGYLDPVTGRPILLSLHFFSSAKAVGGRLWAQLLFPLNWEAARHSLLFPSVLLLCIGFLLLAFKQKLKPKVALALVMATAGAVLPAIHLSLIGESGLGSRIYYLPSLPFCILLACLIESLRPHSTVMAAVILIALAAGFSMSLMQNLRAWHDVAYLADAACSAAASGHPVGSPVPSELQGVFYFSNGFPECVSMKRHSESQGNRGHI